jgi:hypothetical protein
VIGDEAGCPERRGTPREVASPTAPAKWWRRGVNGEPEPRRSQRRSRPRLATTGATPVTTIRMIGPAHWFDARLDWEIR